MTCSRESGFTPPLLVPPGGGGSWPAIMRSQYGRPAPPGELVGCYTWTPASHGCHRDEPTQHARTLRPGGVDYSSYQHGGRESPRARPGPPPPHNGTHERAD